ncbi:efflux RND transporter periplasmic adaptor subunit [Thiobacillus sp.]|uniref:efflux RND transporter periplasmic adaptor subunit n=1 Tax=Thiobacillus sp. TaxID=924 RepID=UPI00286E64A5|nr:HlyD family efflux transporter periplasmic adaptor subunit [Thiobacillus sp.]
MTTLKKMARHLPWILVLLMPRCVLAHGGEDHGDEARAPVSLSASGPQLELKSPEVELLGMVRDGRLTVYADRYATNEPILNAKIELESTNGNGHKLQLRPAQDGSYAAAADWLQQPGTYEVVVSVEAAGVEDLLIGSLQIPGLKPGEASGRTWLDYGKWAAGGMTGVIALLALFKFIRRRKGAAASLALPVLAAVLLGGHSHPGFAHGDEDHGAPPTAAPAATAVNVMPAAAQRAPVRLPDGSVVMPKPAQRLLGIRTVLGEPRDIARTVTLNGQISADPNFSGRVQSSQAGRIAAPAGGFPSLGMKVAKGQILAWIEPAASSIDTGNQQAQLAELSSRLGLAEKRAQRLEQLAGSLPQKEIDAARAEAVNLKARKAAVAASLFQREALRAPVAGVVSQSGVVAGQVVDAREILFEVINPSRLRVEAVAYDTALSGQVAGASGLTAGNQPLRLTFIGQSYQLREQALPMQFGIQAPVPALSVEQPVQVFVQTRQTLRGIAVPQGSVTKNGSGETMVWVHAAAERFVPKKVKVQPLDAQSVAVLEGLHDGDRVVTQGAALLTQIR